MVQSFTGSYRVVPVCTKLYRVLQGRTELYGVL